MKLIRLLWWQKKGEIMIYNVIFCLFLTGFHVLAWASGEVRDLPAPAVKDVDKLQQIKVLHKGNFRKEDFRNRSIVGCKIKAGDFTAAQFGVLDLTDVDYYNACFRGAKIENLEDIFHRYPTFNVMGRIDKIMQGDEYNDVSIISFDELPRYRERAAQEDPVACFITAYLYETFGTLEQEKIAYKLYDEASKRGLLEAYNNLGWMNENRRGIADGDNAYSLAEACYRKADELDAQRERERLKNQVQLTLAQKEAGSKIRLNFARIMALRFQESSVAHQVGNLYSKVNDACYDSTLAYLWFLRAANKGYAKSMFKVGYLLVKGLGVSKNILEGVNWLKKAREGGSIGAARELGDIYYYGEGGVVKKDLEQSFACRLQAAEGGDIAAMKDLAYMYEKGEGTEPDFVMARSYYGTVAQSTKSVSATYGVARVHDFLGEHEKAFKAYERTLELAERTLALPQGVKDGKFGKGGRTHVGALYHLAKAYEKGIGTKVDREKAFTYFKWAAEEGHVSSRIKLVLMRKSSLIDFEKLREMPEEVQLNYIRESERILHDVAEHHALSVHIVLPVGFNPLTGQILRMDLGEWVMHRINEDFEAALSALKHVQNERVNDVLQVNYEFVTYDPYLKYYFKDINAAIADDAVSDEALEQLFDEMQKACKEHPAYIPSFDEGLNGIKAKLLQAGRNQYALRKMVLKYYRLWINEESKNAIQVPKGTTNPLMYRQGEAALRFVQNDARCADGLERYLASIEMKEIYGSSDETLPLGISVSKVLNKYKEDFLAKHKNLDPDEVEEAVEAMRLLKERMRLPLGLPGTFSPMLYPQLGQGDSEVYSPVNVMERFLKGGAIPERNGVIIEPYTSEWMVSLIKEAVYSSSKMLTKEQLNVFARRNAKLKQFFEKAFIELEPNKYFDPDAEEGKIYTDAFFTKILRMHGYLVKVSQ